MAKICPSCGFKNDDEKLFCGSCGDPLGGDLKLIMDMEKTAKKEAEKAKTEPQKAETKTGTTKVSEEHVTQKLKKEDTSGNGLLFACITGLIVVCGGLVYILMKLL